MRTLNLFIILIVVICAGGLCTTPLTSAASNDDTMESCHSMDHSAQADETLNIEQDFNHKTYINSSCCEEYLTNSISDLHDAHNHPEELKYQFQTITTNTSYNLKDRSQREHDPPDLQILNSTFLI